MVKIAMFPMFLRQYYSNLLLVELQMFSLYFDICMVNKCPGYNKNVRGKFFGQHIYMCVSVGKSFCKYILSSFT